MDATEAYAQCILVCHRSHQASDGVRNISHLDISFLHKNNRSAWQSWEHTISTRSRQLSFFEPQHLAAQRQGHNMQLRLRAALGLDLVSSSTLFVRGARSLTAVHVASTMYRLSSTITWWLQSNATTVWLHVTGTRSLEVANVGNLRHWQRLQTSGSACRLPCDCASYACVAHQLANPGDRQRA